MSFGCVRNLRFHCARARVRGDMNPGLLGLTHYFLLLLLFVSRHGPRSTTVWRQRNQAAAFGSWWDI